MEIRRSKVISTLALCHVLLFIGSALAQGEDPVESVQVRQQLGYKDCSHYVYVAFDSTFAVSEANLDAYDVSVRCVETESYDFPDEDAFAATLEVRHAEVVKDPVGRVSSSQGILPGAQAGAVLPLQGGNDRGRFDDGVDP